MLKGQKGSMKKSMLHIMLFSIVIGLLSSCILSQNKTETTEAEKTLIAEGVDIRLTSDAQTEVFQKTATGLPLIGTAISAVPTNINTQEISLTPSPTNTFPPTLTPFPSLTPIASLTPFKTPTKTLLAPLCDNATLISTTIPDGSTFLPGYFFSKSWRLQNTGSCTWTTGYALVFLSGTQMEGQAVYNFTSSITTGQSIDLSISLRTPASPGTFTGLWMLRNASGKLFGTGENSSQAFGVIVKVNAPESEKIPSSMYSLDFVAGMCKAIWKSGAGINKVRIPCPDSTYQYAWGLILTKPKFEGGRVDDERTIWMHPDKGYIEATYPDYTVKKGDHFRTWIGCAYGYSGCKVKYKIDYKKDDGTVVNLGVWNEIADDTIHELNIDLSGLSGQTIKFILTVQDNGNANAAQALWLAPRILPVKPTKTATATNTVTITPTPTCTATLTPTPTPTSTTNGGMTPTETETPTPTKPPP
jgi:hypothetical protein